MRLELALASPDRGQVMEGLVRVLQCLHADPEFTDVHLTEEDGEHILVATTTITERLGDDALHLEQ